MADQPRHVPTVNPGYARGQIAKALTTAEHHDDPQIQERAKEKIAKWVAIHDAILRGTTDFGSRRPLKDRPAWVTLEVATGGFATGDCLANGPILPHERALADSQEPLPDAEVRRVLNGFFVSDAGLARLQTLLDAGNYDIAVPEEGALLTVAWLVEQGHTETARLLLDEIAPFFADLRFYPVPLSQPREFGARVCLQTVGATAETLRHIKPKRRILAQQEAIEIWAPFYDRLIELFLDTVEGERPRLARQPDGRALRTATGGYVIEGGWPCRRYPDGWRVRGEALLADYDELRRQHRLCGRPDSRKSAFAELCSLLRRCLEDAKALTGRDVGRIRLILARHLDRWGTPGSSRWRAERERQAAQTAGPSHYRIAQVVAARLSALPQDQGLETLEPVACPVTDEEAARWVLPTGAAVPPAQCRKLQRALMETIEVLVKRGVITSGETLARVLPQVTADLTAAGISEPRLRRLYAAIYRAFRQRRSLLLLNLESQVRIEELPWIAAIQRFRQTDLSVQETARQSLEEVAKLTIVSFPQAIVPNKLLQELRALAQSAGLDLPLVDELAVDIFMGRFSGKFLEATKSAADLLEGTLYATYYGIDYAAIRRMTEAEGPVTRRWFRRPAPLGFAELCAARAGVVSDGWNPTINGMIIEQQQILTSQNLAVLFQAFALSDLLQNRMDDLAKRCFTWICRHLQIKTDNRHARLIALKNTAYAWRQMIFYLSLMPKAQALQALTWSRSYLNEQPQAFRRRFEPAHRGLDLALEGIAPDDALAAVQGVRRFLGWSKDRHWLLDEV